MNKEELFELNEELFSRYNCAQTVLLSMAKYFEMEDELLEHVAAPFGGGLCGTRISVCGAVSGGIMFLGLKERNGAASSSAGQELLKFVEEHYGHRCCDAILDIDFSDADQVAREKAAKGKSICTPLIKDICLWIAERYEKV